LIDRLRKNAPTALRVGANSAYVNAARRRPPEGGHARVRALELREREQAAVRWTMARLMAPKSATPRSGGCRGGAPGGRRERAPGTGERASRARRARAGAVDVLGARDEGGDGAAWHAAG